MLKIRAQQYAKLSDYMRNQFEDRMVAELGAEFPEESAALSEAGLRATIRKGIARAESFGVLLEDDIARFLVLVLRKGPDFETQPGTQWAQPILKDPNLSGTQKMDELDDYEDILDAAAGGGVQ